MEKSGSLKAKCILKSFNILLFVNDRLDTTLVDFNDMRWERGDITFVFDGEAPSNEGLTVLDNKLHVFQKIRSEVRLLQRIIRNVS